MILDRPLSELPDELFDRWGIRNPNKPSNLSIALDAIEVTAAVPGDIVECGVYQGSSLGTLGLKIKEMRLNKKLWGLDSFKGFPSATPEDCIDDRLPGTSAADYFADTSEERVASLIRRLGLDENVFLVAGYFEQTCPSLPVHSISVLRMDCDLYHSYKTCLKYFYPKVTSSGWIVFDEYYSKKYPGARRAVDEFFADKPEKPILAQQYLTDSSYERWYVVKK